MQIILDFSIEITIFAAKNKGNAPLSTLYSPMNKFEKTLHFIKEVIRNDSPFYGHIYLVGGCVRDELLGKRYSDLDLLIDLPNGQREFVEYMCSAHSDRCKGPFYYQRYGTTAMDVIIDGSLTLVECVEPHIEEYAEDGVTLLSTRFCSLQEDSTRRDYTCNALYKNLHTNQIFDPTGRGIDDLKAGLLITPSEPGTIYRQDPVRMLRGIRFKHQKGFQLDDDCWRAICENADSMATSAPKRLRDELNKMLKARTFGEGIHDLYCSGLLRYVMPGLTELLQEQRPLPGTADQLTPWQHTRQALAMQGREHPRTDTVYKLACLFMDIALYASRDQAGQLLAAAGIGKEKVASILHVTDLYRRFSTFYADGQYVAKPSALPRFITGLAKSRDEFRRLVRALNTGLEESKQLPWRIFYDDGHGPESAQRRAAQRRQKTPDGLASGNTPPTASPRNHKRNVKRREQRKRAKSMRRNTES